MNSVPTCVDPQRGRGLAAYELGLLSPEARAGFESHLAGCAACLEDLHSAAPVSVALTSRPAEILSALDQAETVIEGPSLGARLAEWLRRPFGVSVPGGAWIPAAASLAVVILLVRPGPSPDLADLARVAPVPYVPLETRESGRAEATRSYREGMSHYAEGRWGEAGEALSRAVTAGEETLARSDLDQAFFYRGLSLLPEGRSREALAPLERATESAIPALADRARWHLAQRHLLEGDAPAAVRILTGLADGSPGYAEAAAEQLAGIRELERR